jgi:putative transposase
VPNQVWVTDITYIPTGEGWLYLAAVKDLHTCEIVGWSMDSQMTQTLVMSALTAAYWKKKPPPGLLHYSDRGSQYCSARLSCTAGQLWNTNVNEPQR